MFETNYRNSLPGYTGHVPGRIENDAPTEAKEARKHIPGMISKLLKASFNNLY